MYAAESSVERLWQHLQLDKMEEQAKPISRDETAEMLRVVAELDTKIESSSTATAVPIAELKTMLQRLITFLYYAERSPNIRKIHFMPFLDLLRLLELMVSESMPEPHQLH